MTKRFDSRAWRMAEKLAGAPKSAYRYVQEQAPAVVKRWDPAAKATTVPPGVHALCAGDVAGLTISQKLEAFRHSVASGAHVVADELAAEVYRSIPGLVADRRKRALETLITHNTALGETAQVERLHRDYEEHRTADSGIDPVVLSEKIDGGQVSARDIEQLLQSRWADVLRNPQLHLLSHRSNVQSRATSSTDALNRYLRTQGSEQIVALGHSGHYLRDLRLAPASTVSGGPLVSVLVSAFNAEETIDYAVRSITEQSYQNLEVLVCDDASTDNTAQILSDRYGKHPKVSLFRSVQNQGTYNIRNALIARARGELITVQDADDLSLPRRIEHQVRQLRVPTKRASVTNLLRVKPDGRIEFFRDKNANRMAIVSLMASRRVFSEIGPYRSASFGADFEFLEKLKARFGAASVARVRSPQMLCLWAEQSVTRQSGAQALSTGYRSPARRLYSDLVYRQRVLGSRRVSDEHIDQELQASGNWRAPSDIDPC